MALGHLLLALKRCAKQNRNHAHIGAVLCHTALNKMPTLQIFLPARFAPAHLTAPFTQLSFHRCASFWHRRSPAKRMVRYASAESLIAEGNGADGSRTSELHIGASRSSEDISGPMLEPSAFNRNWVRLAWVSAAVIIAARSTEYLPSHVAAFIHVNSWGLLIGTNLWTTFIAGITMFKNLPRQTFGRLQAKLFPQYFGLAAAALVLQIGTLAFGVPGGIATPQLITLGVGLLSTLANWLYIEPVATDLMFKRYNLENAEGEKDAAKIKQLYKAFGKFHGISSLANLVVLGAAVSHGWWLASRLSLGAA